MSAAAAFLAGWRLVGQAWGVSVAAIAATIALATIVTSPAGAALGPASRTTGIAFASVQALAPGGLTPASLAAALAWIAGSTFVLGALLARLAGETAGLAGSLRAGRVRLGRFVRIAAIAAVPLVALELLAPLAGTGALAGAVVMLFAISLVCGYAEVRLVVEDRRAASGALAAGARFVRAHAGAAIGLHLLDGALLAAALAGAWALATPADSASVPARAAAQLPLVPALLIQVQWLASQAALVRHHLGTRDAALG